MRRIAAIALTLFSSAAWAEDGVSARLSGRVFADGYAPIVDGGSDFPFAGSSGWLQLDPRLGPSTGARLLLEGRAWQEPGPRSVSGVELREAYASGSSSGFELRFGRQIIPWGKSDVINPTDFLSARDYNRFNPDPEVQRVGGTSLLLSWVPAQGSSPLSFTAVWSPIGPQSELLIPGSLVPQPITLLSRAASPGAGWASSELALKSGYGGAGWDASIVYFRGLSRLSGLAREGSAAIAPQAQRMQAAGGDISANAGAWILRGECAWVWTDGDGASDAYRDPSHQPSHWDSVAGIERPLGDRFRMQGQVFWRLIPRFVPANEVRFADLLTGPIDRGLLAGNALLLNFQERSRPGATLRLSFATDSSPWEGEVFAVMNWVGGDYLVRPKLEYAWSEAFRTIAGLQYYGGPQDRPLGALSLYSSVFFEGKYVF
jgi:hypothetical protein